MTCHLIAQWCVMDIKRLFFIMKFIFYLILFFSFSTCFAKTPYINIKTREPNQITLTFDACGGTTDMRILYLLKDYGIPATIFVTKQWLEKNPDAILFLKNNSNLFKIENHGALHHAAIMEKIGPYHLTSVQNNEGLSQEVNLADQEIFKDFGYHPHWYRTAGALYDKESISWLENNHWEIGGYSIAGDEGATASVSKIVSNLNNATPGDVLLFHINKPHSNTYEGLKKGLPILLEKKYKLGFLPN